jgi:tRNA 2-thiouridine synthesizing protein A
MPNETIALDAKGLACPLPVLKARKLLKSMGPGEILEIEATDQAATRDFTAFCEAAGHQLLERRTSDGVLYFKICKGS